MIRRAVMDVDNITFTVALPERLCQLRMERYIAGETNPEAIQESDVMPDVGPSFDATIVNIGGGGIGLQVVSGDASGISRHRLHWLKFQLPNTDGCAFMEPSRQNSQGMTRLTDNQTPIRRATWAALLYLVAGLAWIAFSDRAVEAWFPDPETLSLIQTWKGVGEVS